MQLGPMPSPPSHANNNRETKATTIACSLHPPQPPPQQQKRVKGPKHGHAPQMTAPTLPPEILSEVIDNLDTAKDKATLHSLLFVSRTVSAVALPRLYARLKLNDAQFAQLVEGSRDDQSRHQRFSPESRHQRFSLIQHLELCPPPSAGTMATVYTALSDESELLFPNVKTLEIEDPDYKSEEHEFRKNRDEAGGIVLPPTGLALFDAPDVCIRGICRAIDALDCLPAKSVASSTLTVHTDYLEHLADSNIPRGWRKLVVYHIDVVAMNHHEEHTEFMIMSKPSSGWSREPMVLYLPNNERMERSLQAWLHHYLHYRPYWDPSNAHCLVFDDAAPACRVCRKLAMLTVNR